MKCGHFYRTWADFKKWTKYERKTLFSLLKMRMVEDLLSYFVPCNTATKNDGAYFFDIIFLVTAYKEEQFKRINGFSNEYWGWGGEDDDLFRRTTHRLVSKSFIIANTLLGFLVQWI